MQPRDPLEMNSFSSDDEFINSDSDNVSDSSDDYSDVDDEHTHRPSLAKKIFSKLSSKLQDLSKEIKKDFVDTFKPFGYSWQNSTAQRDFFLPFIGLWNVVKSAAILIYAPFKLLFDLGASTVSAIRARSFTPFISKMQTSLATQLPNFIISAVALLQNAFKIAAAPFIWFLRMPLRGTLTIIKKNSSKADQISKGFSATFKEFKKDFVDTFKPYKSGNFYIQRDFVMPLRGLLKALKAATGLVYAPCKLLYDLGPSAMAAIRAGSFSTFIDRMQLSLLENVGIFMLCATELLVNVLKLAAAPFIWFLRMPLRGVLSLALGRPTIISSLKPKAETIEALIKKQNKDKKECREIDQKMMEMEDKIEKSFDKCVGKGQKLGVTKDTITQAFLNYKLKRISRNTISSPLQSPPNTNEEADQTALRALSIFTKSSVQANVDISQSTPDLNAGQVTPNNNARTKDPLQCMPLPFARLI